VNKFFTIPKFLLLGITIFVSKLVLIAVAYFFNGSQYNIFNQAYFAASLLILFGSLGFGFAIVQIKISPIKVALAVFVNIFIAVVVIQFISEPFDSIYKIISVFLYSYFGSLGGVFLFKLLFEGNYKRYSQLMFVYAFFHLLLIPFVLLLNADIFLCFPFITFLWFAVSFPLIVKRIKGHDNELRDLYKIGFSAFIINTAVPLALVIDKYFVNNFFGIEIANACTFAWGLTAPLFYIGSLVEKMIFSARPDNGAFVIKKSFLLLGSLIVLYTSAVLSVVFFFPVLLPSSVDTGMLRNIFTFMAGGFALYVFFHFPVNGFLFKYSEVSKQKKAAAYFTIITFFMLVFFGFIMAARIVPDYRLLLAAVWVFIFTMLVVKNIIIFNPFKKKGWLKI
jgi:hypothetical protein